MSRPPGLPIDDVVDASVQAHAGNVIERRFPAARMPRFSAAGVVEPSDIRLLVRFSIVEGRVALNGTLTGTVTMTCQRCMRPVAIELDDGFQVLIVDEEAEIANDCGGYEPIVADVARLDLRWLAEEQTLLSVPLVPKHAAEECSTNAKDVAPPSGDVVRQRPFAELRNILRER